MGREQQIRKRKEKEYEQMVQKAQDIKKEDRDKEEEKRLKHLENRKQLEQQIKAKDRGCKIGMSAAESKINKELLQMVRRTLPEKQGTRDTSPPMQQQALGFAVPRD